MNFFVERIRQGLFFLFLFFLVYGMNARADGTQTADSEIKIEDISISLMGQVSKKAEENKDKKFLELQIGINDRLRLNVRNLQALIDAKNKCPAQSNCKKNIALYFNGMKISEASSIILEEGKQVGTIEFVLKYDSSTEIKQNWTSLLGAPIPNFKGEKNDSPEPGFFTRPINVAIGLDDGSKWIPIEDNKVKEKTFYVVLEQVNPFVQLQAIPSSVTFTAFHLIKLF